MTPAEILDALILIWLIGTWFYEGHHRKCVVAVQCTHCGQETEHACVAGKETRREDR